MKPSSQQRAHEDSAHAAEYRTARDRSGGEPAEELKASETATLIPQTDRVPASASNVRGRLSIDVAGRPRSHNNMDKLFSSNRKKDRDTHSVKSSDNSLNSRDSKGRLRRRRHSPSKAPIDESLLDIPASADMQSDFAFSQVEGPSSK